MFEAPARLPAEGNMRSPTQELMDNLLALQTLEFGSRKGTKEEERARLRALIPEQILGHFDRLLVRGKKGLAALRSGVCSECHIRVPTGTLVTLAHGTDIQLCGNCGRYLYLPEGETVGPTPAPPPRRPRKRREPKAEAES